MRNPQTPEVSVAELPPDAALLDVREDDEWQAGHAPHAVHIRMSELTGRLSEIPRADTIYVICRTGARSARVTDYLNGSGRSAVNVAGGMVSWARAGHAVVADGSALPRVI